MDHIEKPKSAIGLGCRGPRSAVRCLSVSEDASNGYAKNSAVELRPPSWCLSNCGPQASSMDLICKLRIQILIAARLWTKQTVLCKSQV